MLHEDGLFAQRPLRRVAVRLNVAQRALSVTQRARSVTQRALSVTQRALSVTQRALSVTQRALSVTQRAHRQLLHLVARQLQQRLEAARLQLERDELLGHHGQLGLRGAREVLQPRHLAERRVAVLRRTRRLLRRQEARLGRRTRLCKSTRTRGGGSQCTMVCPLAPRVVY
jgi:hypothetical protein